MQKFMQFFKNNGLSRNEKENLNTYLLEIYKKNIISELTDLEKNQNNPELLEHYKKMFNDSGDFIPTMTVAETKKNNDNVLKSLEVNFFYKEKHSKSLLIKTFKTTFGPEIKIEKQKPIENYGIDSKGYNSYVFKISNIDNDLFLKQISAFSNKYKIITLN